MQTCFKAKHQSGGGEPYPLSLLPDPDALQQLVDDLGGVLAAIRGAADVGDFLWTSPVVCKRDRDIQRAAPPIFGIPLVTWEADVCF